MSENAISELPRKLIKFDPIEDQIIENTMTRFGLSYNGAIGYIIRVYGEQEQRRKQQQPVEPTLVIE